MVCQFSLAPEKTEVVVLTKESVATVGEAMFLPNLAIKYCEPWADSFSKEMYRNLLAQVQRAEVAMVIAGVNPFALHAAERRIIYLRKGGGNKKAASFGE